MGAEPLTIRPRSGTRALRENASLRLEDGAITATDRRGRSRTFPLIGAENSPVCVGSALREGGDYWLEDPKGRALLVLDSLEWDGDELFNFKQAAGLELNVRSPGESPAPKRPDVFRVMDPPYVSWAIRATAVGGAAISLRWLHVAPEVFVYVVALPALVFLLWCLFMNKISSPGAEDQRRVDKSHKGGGPADHKKRAKKRR